MTHACNLEAWCDCLQVLGKAFEIVRLIAANPDSQFGRAEALVAVNGALDKLADIKLKVRACPGLVFSVAATLAS